LQPLKKFYEENLYPLQDGILNCVKNLNLPFYLTGGTALSRGYFNHRYSDDIDLFTNSNPDFKSHSDAIVLTLKNNTYAIDTSTMILSQDYVSFYVSCEGLSNIQCKLDLVNDKAPHFGIIQPTPVYYKTDDWYNILINKFTALFRLEIKDFVDIWIIAKNKKFNWDDIITKGREKELGLDAIVCAHLMKTISFELLPTIKWAIDVSFDEFLKDMDTIAIDLLKGCDNSLVT